MSDKETIYTHQGYEVGCDARSPSNYRREVLLRETAKYWVGNNGKKYLKTRYGAASGSGAWPLYKLDLSTIEPLVKAEIGRGL